MGRQRRVREHGVEGTRMIVHGQAWGENSLRFLGLSLLAEGDAPVDPNDDEPCSILVGDFGMGSWDPGGYVRGCGGDWSGGGWRRRGPDL